jgi:hypothetical protein
MSKEYQADFSNRFAALVNLIGSEDLKGIGSTLNRISNLN